MEINGFDIEAKKVGELYKKMKNGELVYDPFYQRKSVWEPVHEVEFIKTIMLGFPCPEIFLAEGEYDIATHTSYTHVIDGQQRLRTIEKYLDNKMEVDGKTYTKLLEDKQKEIASYKIPIVNLKLSPEIDEEKIKNIFYRLNMTDYSLGETELLLSQFSTNEFVLLSRLLSGEDIFNLESSTEESEKKFRNNPFINNEFKEWVVKKDFKYSGELFSGEKEGNSLIYTSREVKRSWNTMDILNILGIYVEKKYHGRNLKHQEISNLTSKIKEKRDDIYDKATLVSKLILELELEKKRKRKSKFHQRGSFFSLFTCLMLCDYLEKINVESLRENLKTFEKKLPKDYSEASRNSVHERKQRELRGKYIDNIISMST